MNYLKNSKNKDLIEVSKDTTGNYTKSHTKAVKEEIKRRKNAGFMRKDAGTTKKKNNDVFGLSTSFKW